MPLRRCNISSVARKQKSCLSFSLQVFFKDRKNTKTRQEVSRHDSSLMYQRSISRINWDVIQVRNHLGVKTSKNDIHTLFGAENIYFKAYLLFKSCSLKVWAGGGQQWYNRLDWDQWSVTIWPLTAGFFSAQPKTHTMTTKQHWDNILRCNINFTL